MATVNLGRVGLVLKGEYDASTKYEKLDVVTYQGSSYIAKQTTTGNAPTNESFWQLQSEKGEKGDKGDAGGGLTRLDDQTPVTVDGVLAGKNGKLAPADFVPAEILPTNTVAQAGIVAAPTANNANSLWSTDGSGNPAWRYYDYQTKAQIQQLIATAISESGHASFEKIDHIPTVEEAKDNILYLVYNTKTAHYDIYAKVVNEKGTPEVLLIDDTTVDLSDYVTNEALAAKDYATNTALNTAITGITTNLNNKVDKESGKGLSSNDYTADDKSKLEGIEASADVNKIESVKLNGEPLPIDEQKAVNIDLSDYATDSELSSGLSGKVDKQEGKQLSTEDFTTAYKNKLDGIPEGGGGGEVNIINTVKVNGTPLVPDAEKAVDVEIPTKTSELQNDSGFITSNDIPEGAAASNTVPKAPAATGSVGNELAFARGDHVHPMQTYLPFYSSGISEEQLNNKKTFPGYSMTLSWLGGSVLGNPTPGNGGELLNIHGPGKINVIQLFFGDNGGQGLYVRRSNSDTDFTNWIKLAEINDIAASNFTGVLPIEKGGTGNNDGMIPVRHGNEIRFDIDGSESNRYLEIGYRTGWKTYAFRDGTGANGAKIICGPITSPSIPTIATSTTPGLVKPGTNCSVGSDGTLNVSVPTVNVPTKVSQLQNDSGYIGSNGGTINGNKYLYFGDSNGTSTNGYGSIRWNQSNTSLSIRPSVPPGVSSEPIIELNGTTVAYTLRGSLTNSVDYQYTKRNDYATSNYGGTVKVGSGLSISSGTLSTTAEPYNGPKFSQAFSKIIVISHITLPSDLASRQFFHYSNLIFYICY